LSWRFALPLKFRERYGRPHDVSKVVRCRPNLELERRLNQPLHPFSPRKGNAPSGQEPS
jgi:hypothetical protein